MASENETIADIVAEMRRGTKLPGYWRSCDLNEILAYHADRIEAAWKREAAEIEVNAAPLPAVMLTHGNAAALREALESADSLIAEGIETDVDKELEHPFHLEFAREQIAAALSEPPRNCDVGDGREQERRYEDYCHAHLNEWNCCQDCPLVGEPSCEFAWGQMPYAAEEGAGK